MKSAKKILATLLALVMCLGVLAGCEQQPAETTTAPTTTAATQGTTAGTVATEPGRPATNAEFYPIDYDGTLTVATAKVDVDKGGVNWTRWEEWTGVDVDWLTITQEQSPLLMIAEEDQPDIFFQASGLSVAQINEYGQQGVLLNFMDHLDKMPNLAARYAEHPKLFTAVDDAEGNVYTLPYYCNTLSMAGNLFYVRYDMTKAAGIEELPTTIEGFLEMCKTLKEYYKDVEGYIPMVTDGPNSMNWNGNWAKHLFPAFGELMQPGIGTNADATQITAGFATEQYKHYLEFLNEMYTNGYLDPDCFSAEGSVGRAKFQAKTATIAGHHGGATVDMFDSGKLEYQVYPPMTSQYQSEARWMLPNNYMSGIYCVNADLEGEDLDAALAFLDALYTIKDDPINDEGTVWGISLWLGEESVDFVDNGDGTYTGLPHEGFDTFNQYLATAGTGSAAFLEWPMLMQETGANKDDPSDKKSVGTRDIYFPLGVEVLYTSSLNLTQDEQDVYNDTWVDIETYIKQSYAAFVTGQTSIADGWDDYVATLETMGLQDVIDVYQAALDRYNAG